MTCTSLKKYLKSSFKLYLISYFVLKDLRNEQERQPSFAGDNEMLAYFICSNKTI